MLPGTCRRSTTREPTSASGNHRSLHHSRHGIPSTACVAGASWPSASRRPLERPRRPPSSPTTCATLTPEELPIAAVFLTGRPFAEADQRAAGLGWSAIATTVTDIGRRPAIGARRGVRPLVRPRDRRGRGPAHGRPRAAARDEPDTPRGGRRVRRDRGRLRAGPQVGHPAQPARTLRPDDRQVHRQGSRRRPAHRPARGPGRGGHRARLRPPARRRQVGGDARRRRRAAGRHSPATTGSTTRLAGALPPAQVHARLAGRGRHRDHHPPRPRGLGRGQVRRHPCPAPQAWLGGPALLARPARHQQRLPGDRRGRHRAAPGTASSTARSSAGATARSCRSSRSRAGSGARRRRPRSRRRCRSSSSPSMRWRSVPAAASRSSRCCACRCPSGGPASTRSSCRSTTDGGRFARSHLIAAADVDAVEAAFADSRGRRNEGLMVKDPDSIYAPGRRGLGWLKMKKALATIDCVVVGVEVGHGKRHGVLSDYTFAVRDTESDRLVNIGKAYSGLTDAEIAEMTRWFEAHTIARQGATTRSSRRSSSRSRSTSSSARTATARGSRCASRGSSACARTRRSTRSTPSRR